MLLNIFSRNYREFARLMAPEGLVIKVVPGERYLEEVRLALHGGVLRQARVMQISLAQHFAEVSTVEVQYRAELMRTTCLRWWK